MKVRSVVLPIILVNIVVYILQGLYPTAMNQFLLSTSDVFIRPWILVTSMFMHGGFAHLFFNMYALFLFGPLVEHKIGWKRFLGIYFFAGIVAGFGFYVFQELILGKAGFALGASGAIMAIIGLTIMLFPDLKVLLLFFIPMSMRTAGILFALFDLFIVIEALNNVNVGIASSAHLAGLAVGLLYGWFLVKKGKKFKQKFERKRSSRIINVKSRSENINLSDKEIEEYIKNGRL